MTQYQRYVLRLLLAILRVVTKRGSWDTAGLDREVSKFLRDDQLGPDQIG